MVYELKNEHCKSTINLLQQKLKKKKEKEQGYLGGSVDKNHLPMQETWVQSLIQEDSTCCRATKPVCHNH